MHDKETMQLHNGMSYHRRVTILEISKQIALRTGLCTNENKKCWAHLPTHKANNRTHHSSS